MACFGAMRCYRESLAQPIFPTQMVDIHSHILPGLDDGAPDMEAALDMLRLAGERGVTDMAATPHAKPQYRVDPARTEGVLAELRAAAGGSPRPHLGCGLHPTPEKIHDAPRKPGDYT